jgi:hypothetical protein
VIIPAETGRDTEPGTRKYRFGCVASRSMVIGANLTDRSPIEALSKHQQKVLSECTVSPFCFFCR